MGSIKIYVERYMGFCGTNYYDIYPDKEHAETKESEVTICQEYFDKLRAGTNIRFRKGKIIGPLTLTLKKS